MSRQRGITIFDRSCYGSVEGFCSEYDWLRAYGETLVEAEDKRFVRIKILRKMVDRLDAAPDD